MKGKRILVVSSDPPLLNLFQNDLPAKSYQVTHTQDTGEELKAVLNKVLPDLVVLDIMMPQLDGIEVCLRLRQWSQVPIIMLSAWGTRKGMVKGLDLSADSYLTEPFTITELMTRIEETLQRDTKPPQFPINRSDYDCGILQTGHYS